MVEKEYILKETARRIIDSPRTKEQMLNMLEGVPTLKKEKRMATSYSQLAKGWWIWHHNTGEFDEYYLVRNMKFKHKLPNWLGRLLKR